MELLGVTPELNLYDQDWPILTAQAQLPPAKFFQRQRSRQATDSMVSGGPTLERPSIVAVFQRPRLFHARSRTAIMPGVDIGRGAKKSRRLSIADVIYPRMEIGIDTCRPSRGFRHRKGVVLVTPDMLGSIPITWA